MNATCFPSGDQTGLDGCLMSINWSMLIPLAGAVCWAADFAINGSPAMVSAIICKISFRSDMSASGIEEKAGRMSASLPATNGQMFLLVLPQKLNFTPKRAKKGLIVLVGNL